jgi:hypothetical protein
MAKRAPILAASVIGLVIGVAAGCQTIVQPSPRSSSSPAASPSAVAVVPTPEPTQEVGPLVEGIPTTLDGEWVFKGDALRAEIRDRIDAKPFYAGGWLRDVDTRGGFCVFQPPPPLFDLCDFGFSLYDGRTGYWDISLSIGRPPDTVIDPSLPFGPTRAAILRLRVNDPTCTPDLSVHPACLHIPVIQEVAWLGPVETSPPVPTERPAEPTDGLTRAEAIALGRAEVIGPEELLCARLLTYSEVEGGLHSIKDGYNDPWVWYLGFKRGPQSYAEVVYQYKTGRFLFSSAGHGPGAGPQHC